MQTKGSDFNIHNKKIKNEILAVIGDIINRGDYVQGNAVELFSNNLATYLQVKYVIPCANGTDALQIAIMALDLEPGDEIITTSYSFVAVAEVALLLGLKVIFVDIDPYTFCIDIHKVEDAVTSRTKAIIPVHLFGQAAAMEEIMEMAARYNLFIIEDNAQALGCLYTFSDGKSSRTGAIGTVGITSFYPTKNLSCLGDGGAIFVNCALLAEKIRMLADHGQSAKNRHLLIGCNSRLDTIQAAILDIKLKYLDAYILKRQAVAETYDRYLSMIPEIQIPFRSSSSVHVFHQYTITLKNTSIELLKKFLNQKGIPANVYYETPVHCQPFVVSKSNSSFELPVTDQIAKSTISLPIHSELEVSQLEYIIKSICQFFKIKWSLYPFVFSIMNYYDYLN